MPRLSEYVPLKTAPLLARRAAAIAILLACVLRAQGSAVIVGGLMAYAPVQAGPNLLSNPGFEQGSIGWTASGFIVDTAVAHGGQASLRLTAANLSQFAVSASQTLQLKKGVYNFGGWVKLSGVAATTGGGVRFCLHAPPAYPWGLASNCTSLVKGTADWQYLAVTSIVVSQDTPAAFIVDGYGKPDGTAWFDDFLLTRAQYPLQAFMLYPNYRGLLFDDQSQIAKFNITIDPPGGSLPSDFVLSGQVTDEATGTVMLRGSFPTAASLVASFDLSSLLVGHSYQVTFQLNKPDGSQPYTYPAYRIVKASGSLRTSLAVSFDEQNRFLLHGQPSFILGVYDSGMGYPGSQQGWTDSLTTQRRLFELPINFYLNYWYGGVANSSILPLMDVLQQHGIYNLTNANCTGTTSVDQQGGWFMNGPDLVIQQRAAHPAFGGFYAADECSSSLVANVFGHYLQMRTLDPGGITLGTLVADANVPLWRDAVDVLATDPYPLAGAEPATGYPLSLVADATVSTQNAVMGSRPIVMVIQFFQFTSQGRWPTQAELRSMSYGAIVGGANGLFYWSLGAAALEYICNGSDAYHSPSGTSSWCQARIDNFTNLKNVVTELHNLAPVLSMADRPDLLVGNSNPAVRTRVKYDGATAYLIAYNASNATQQVSFQWGQGLTTISVPQEARTLQPNGRSFTDTFLPNDVHVYAIQ